MRRQLSWSQALSDMRADRAPRPDIREERLRGYGLQRPGSVGLSAWRGRSGRRYVVAVYPLTDAPITLFDADRRFLVVLAVARDAGVSRLVAVGDLAWIVRWQAGIVLDGATELHVYHLAETTLDRAEAIEDLREAP